MDIKHLIETNKNFRTKLVNMNIAELANKVHIKISEAQEIKTYAALVAASKGE